MEINKKWIYLFSFFIVTYILQLTISKYISPIVKPSYEYSFENFIIFTYLFNSIVYFLKIILLYGFFKMCLFIYDIKVEYSVLSIVILAEIIKYTLIKGTKIVSFYLSGKTMSLEEFSNYESKFSFTNIFNISGFEDFKYIINFIDVFDTIYVILIVLLFINYYKLKPLKSFNVIGLPYIILLLTIGIFKTFMSM